MAVTVTISMVIAACSVHGDCGSDYAAHLKAQLGLVRTLCTDLNTRTFATTSEMKEVLASYMNQHPARFKERMETLDMFVTTERHAKLGSWRGRWIRSGVRERLDIMLGYSDKVRETLSFDGGIVRSIVRSGDAVHATLHETVGAHWHTANRVSPWTFLYCFREDKYHEMLMLEHRSEYREVQSGPNTVISFRHPKADVGVWFELTIDRGTMRLLERRVYYRDLFHPENRELREIHRFYDYSLFDVDSQRIELPTRGVYSYVLGENGKTVLPEWKCEEVRLTNIAINEVVEASYFEPAIPADAKIYDGLTGLGWLETGMDPNAVIQSYRRGNWWPVSLGAGGVLACIIAMIAIIKSGRACQFLKERFRAEN
jgi:hypothetical protein